MKGKAAFLLLVAFVLAGCARGTAPTGTPVEVAGVAPTASAAAALTQMPAPSPAATQAPSATPAEPSPITAPSANPTSMPQLILTPTNSPSPTPAPTPTPTAVASWWEVSTLLVGPGNPGRLYALQRQAGSGSIAPADVRLLVSDDGGQAWSTFPGGLPAKGSSHNVDMDYAQIDALYASTCEGLYRWSGSGWDLVSPQETTRVAVVYGQPQVLWVVQFPREGHVVVRSNDGGVTWTPADTGLIHFHALTTLGVDPTYIVLEIAAKQIACYTSLPVCLYNDLEEGFR